jgi:uncharacterized damage-inducible protein DinB
MDLQLDQAVAILRRTPTVVNELLRDLPDDWVRTNEGPDTWSPYEIVGHLIQGEETNWIPRAKIILEHGQTRAFEPFDRVAPSEKSQGKTLPALLDTFAQRRERNLDELTTMRITPELLAKRGRHPDLGEVTLAQLLATWTVHDLSHLSQITRVMCKQYGAAVGPWKEYLPILTR